MLNFSFGVTTFNLPLITLIKLGKMLLVIGTWFPFKSSILCSHWEKCPVPLGLCGPCEPLQGQEKM